VTKTVISRSEQFVIYWWTGSGWATHKASAKKFTSPKTARAEMRELGIKHTVNYNPA